MNVKTGIDIIEVDRVKESIERSGENFLKKVYTDSEIEYCKNTNKTMYQHYAARFAVKEATFKAISSLLDDKYGITWQNVETINTENGKPEIKFINLSSGIAKKLEKIVSVDVSISHIEKLAIANVTILVDD